MSITTYQRAAVRAESPREIEYRAFGKATAALLQAQAAGRSDLSGLARALEFNRQLWDLMSADCAVEGNQLPASLRAGVISLAIWVSRYSSQVLREGAALDPLIDVNRSIMEGLSRP